MPTEIIMNPVTGKTITAEFHLPEVPLEQAKAAKRADLANIRWQHETGGMSVNGMSIPTDRETQTIVDRLVKAFDDGDLADPVSFKRADGDWITVDAETARLIKKLGAQHVQGCFKRECELDALISAAVDRAALDAIDLNDAWPAASISEEA